MRMSARRLNQAAHTGTWWESDSQWVLAETEVHTGYENTFLTTAKYSNRLLVKAVLSPTLGEF